MSGLIGSKLTRFVLKAVEAMAALKKSDRKCNILRYPEGAWDTVLVRSLRDDSRLLTVLWTGN
jgi:hypothetical protein